MEIKIPKEIRDYQEAIFFGLSARQLFCSLLAVGAAVALYSALRLLAGTEEVGWVYYWARCRSQPAAFSATTA